MAHSRRFATVRWMITQLETPCFSTDGVFGDVVADIRSDLAFRIATLPTILQDLYHIVSPNEVVLCLTRHVRYLSVSLSNVIKTPILHEVNKIL